MKYFYVVDHFVPFPQSEYGGVWNVIAEHDEECFDIITEADEDEYVNFYGNLRENIKKSTIIPVDPQFQVESGIIESFLT